MEVKDGIGDSFKYRVWFRDDVVAQFDSKEEAETYEELIKSYGLPGVTMVLEPK